MGGPPTGRMRNQMLELREDMGRIRRALVRIDKEVKGWNRISFFDDVEMMVRKGIGYPLLDLCRLPGISKGRADYLYNAGAKNAEDIAEILPNIEDEIDEAFKETLRGIIRELHK
jgi:replicative superfamily II helicase